MDFTPSHNCHWFISQAQSFCRRGKVVWWWPSSRLALGYRSIWSDPIFFLHLFGVLIKFWKTCRRLRCSPALPACPRVFNRLSPCKRSRSGKSRWEGDFRDLSKSRWEGDDGFWFSGFPDREAWDEAVTGGISPLPSIFICFFSIMFLSPFTIKIWMKQSPHQWNPSFPKYHPSLPTALLCRS